MWDWGMLRVLSSEWEGHCPRLISALTALGLGQSRTQLGAAVALVTLTRTNCDSDPQCLTGTWQHGQLSVLGSHLSL